MKFTNKYTLSPEYYRSILDRMKFIRKESYKHKPRRVPDAYWTLGQMQLISQNAFVLMELSYMDEKDFADSCPYIIRRTQIKRQRRPYMRFRDVEDKKLKDITFKPVTRFT